MTQNFSDVQVEDVLGAPIIILSAPRSGSTLLFEQLAGLDPFWSIGGESHAVFRNFPHLRAENANLDSMELSERHADLETAHLFRRCFLALLMNSMQQPYLRLDPAARPAVPIFLEKTPRNALNIPFLRAVFPKARFLYLVRDARQAISSLIEAWTLGLQTGRFVTFQQLPGWHLPAWCFLLPPKWRDMVGRSVPEIAAFQWAACQNAIMDKLEQMPKESWCIVDYDDYVSDPKSALARIAQSFSIDIQLGSAIDSQLPLSRTVITKPDPEKWRRHEKEIEDIWPDIEATVHRVHAFMSTQSA